MPYLSSQSSSLADDEAYYFALAVIKGDIRLVQSMFAEKHQRAYDSRGDKYHHLPRPRQ